MSVSPTIYAPMADSIPMPEIIYVLCPDKNPPLIIFRIVLFHLFITDKTTGRLYRRYIRVRSPTVAYHQRDESVLRHCNSRAENRATYASPHARTFENRARLRLR